MTTVDNSEELERSLRTAIHNRGLDYPCGCRWTYLKDGKRVGSEEGAPEIEIVTVCLLHRLMLKKLGVTEALAVEHVTEDSRAYKLSRDEIAQALSEFMIKKAKLSEAWEAFRIEIATDDRKILASLWLCDLNPESLGVGLGLDSAIYT